MTSLLLLAGRIILLCIFEPTVRVYSYIYCKFENFCEFLFLWKYNPRQKAQSLRC